MSQAASAPAKVCVRCNQDVSKKPRVKDPQGRYLCEPCFAAAQATPAPAPTSKPAVQPQPTGALASKPTAKPALKPAPQPADDNPLLDSLDTGEGEGGDMILPEGYDPSLAMAAATAKPEAPVRAFHPKPQGGKDAKGKKGKAPPEFKCRHCGYNMAGAMSMRCPECGKVNLEPKNDALVETEREVRRQTYLRPCILMGIGWTLSLIILAVGRVGWEAYAAMGVGWLVAIPVGVLTFWVCSLIFLEYDAPYHITALRLAGIYACVGVSDAIGYAVGMKVFGIATFALLILLYMTELEMERWEAIAMAIAGGVIKLVLTILIVVAIAAMFVGTAVVGGPAPVPLVSPSDPNRTQFFDEDGDGRDDDSGVVIPADAVPEDLLPPAEDDSMEAEPASPADMEPMDDTGGDEDDDGGG